MPRYFVETAPTSPADRDRITRLAAVRFPEVAVERRYSLGSDDDTREVWVCRAPSEPHLQRWAAAARLAISTVRKVVVA